MRTSQLTLLAVPLILLAFIFAPNACANASELLTPVYCNYDGESGLPEAAVCQFVNVKNTLCLHFGENSNEFAGEGATIGGRFDNVATKPFSSVTFTVKNYNAAAMQQLLLTAYLVNSSHTTVYAYAYASQPTSKITLSNGDVRLSFSLSALSTIPSHTSLAGATISALELDTVDRVEYPAFSYYVYNVMLNGVQLTDNTKSGGPFESCTF